MRTTILGLLLAISLAAPTNACVVDGPLAIGQLREAISVQRANLRSVSVRASAVCESPHPDTFSALRYQCASESTGKTRVTTLSVDRVLPDGQIVVNDQWLINATDLTHSITISQATSTAAISTGIIEQARTCDVDWHTMNLYNPGLQAAPTAVITDLKHLADNPLSAVRPQLEIVGERECHVLDAPGLPGKPSTLTAWIDVDRGCVVMKWTRHHASGEIVASYEATEIKEIEPGVWFATEGVKTISSRYSPNTTWKISLDKTPSGQPDILLNPELTPSTFTPEIPTGYWVRDPEGNYSIKQ
jgi:hypothetical protein